MYLYYYSYMNMTDDIYNYQLTNKTLNLHVHFCSQFILYMYTDMYMLSGGKQKPLVHIFIFTAYTIHVHAEWRKTLTPSTHIYF
jgi:hypothetical protein